MLVLILVLLKGGGGGKGKKKAEEKAQPSKSNSCRCSFSQGTCVRSNKQKARNRRTISFLRKPIDASAKAEVRVVAHLATRAEASQGGDCGQQGVLFALLLFVRRARELGVAHPLCVLAHGPGGGRRRS